MRLSQMPWTGLYTLCRIERREKQIAEGKGISHEEIGRRIQEWRK